MKAFSILLLFYSSLAYSQSYLSEYYRWGEPKYFHYNGELESYEATGKIKKITAKIIYSNTKDWNKIDSIDKLNTDILEFTPNGKLESESKKYYNSEVIYLNEKYFFDELGQRIRKEEYYGKDFSYAEKFVYHKNNLSEKWIKTTFQTDFFLKERFIYNDKNQLVLEEDLNNNLRTSDVVLCKLGTPDYDTMRRIYYNEQDLVNKIETYAYIYDTQSKTTPTEDQFLLRNTLTVDFLNGKKAKENQFGIELPGFEMSIERVTNYKYDKNGNLVSEKTQSKNPRASSPFKIYNYKDNKLSFIEEGNHENIISQKNYFDENKNLIKIEEIRNNKIVGYRKFNSEGFLIEEKRESIKYEYKIEYDSNGNWIKYSTYKKNVLIKQKQRIIEYYD
ncbi:MAG: hypothetical protein V4548_08770 [Bacteroidota bacterium]